MMLGLAFALGVAAAPALADTVILASDPPKFNEVVRDSSNLSGVIVVGVMAVTGDAPERVPLQASLPVEWTNDGFCAKVITADGLLEAINLYQRQPDGDGGIDGGTVELPFTPAEASQERWAGAHNGEVAALVTKQACDDGAEPDTVEAAVALWNAPKGADASTVRLLINSTSADEVYVFVGDDTDEATPCIPVAEDRPTSVFDMTCEFVLTRPGPTRIEINRVRSGEVEEPQFLVLLHDG